MGAKMSAWIERENKKVQVRYAIFYAADETTRLKKEEKSRTNKTALLKRGGSTINKYTMLG